MTNIKTTLIAFVCITGFCANPFADVSVKVDAQKTGATISKYIYGQFAKQVDEHHFVDGDSRAGDAGPSLCKASSASGLSFAIIRKRAIWLRPNIARFSFSRYRN
jgi:hypothetical protein